MATSRVSLIDNSLADPGLAGERARGKPGDRFAPAAAGAFEWLDLGRAPAGEPNPIAIVALTSAEGFVIQGAAAGDKAGWSVSDAGDFNGDGFADVIVGAYRGDNGGADAGEAYVVFGKAGGFGTIDLAVLANGNEGISIRGNDSGDLVGLSVASAGDVNNDGLDDLIVGAPLNDEGGPDAGRAYVIFGNASVGGTISLHALAPADGFGIQGHLGGDIAGWSVSSAGDVNGDGFDDVILGAYRSDHYGVDIGAAYVIFGKSGGFGDIDVGSITPGTGFAIRGAEDADIAGVSVSSAGDINNDGFDEVIVGAAGFDGPGGAYSDAGAAYVLYGKAGGFADIDLANLAAADGFAIHATEDGAALGRSVSGAGDFNGDGFADLIVDAPYSDDGETNAGAAYIVFGKVGGFTTLTVNDADFQIEGQVAGTPIGSVSAAGDVNGDGYDDVIVGVPLDDQGGIDAGRAYVIFGSATDGGINLEDGDFDDQRGFVIEGEAGDLLGQSVSGAGDVNNDGLADLIVGAPLGDDGGADAGQAYVIFGVAPTESVSRIGTVASQNLVGGDSDDTLDGRDGDDSLRGNGGDDSLIGGGGDDSVSGGGESDRLAGGSGDDSLHGDAGGDTLSGGSGADDLGGGTGDDALSGGDGLDTLSGNRGDDTIGGEAGDDSLGGGGGFDLLSGGSGADTLNGGGGIDTMRGGSGDDRYVAGAIGDTAIEAFGGGNDVVFASADFDAGDNELERLTAASATGVMLVASDYATKLFGDVGADTLIGGDGDDTLRGNGGADSMAGGAGDDYYFVEDIGDVVVEAPAGGFDTVLTSADFDAGVNEIEAILADSATGLALTASDTATRLVGDIGADTLTGGAGQDTLNGAGGDDRMIMSAGNDSMVGGGGADTFVLTNDFGDGDRVAIFGFAGGVDLIEVGAADFGGGLAPGALDADAFAANATGLAEDAEDRFIYNTLSGKLFFDADGTGAGAALLIARFNGAPALDASDFAVV